MCVAGTNCACLYFVCTLASTPQPHLLGGQRSRDTPATMSSARSQISVSKHRLHYKKPGLLGGADPRAPEECPGAQEVGNCSEKESVQQRGFQWPNVGQLKYQV